MSKIFLWCVPMGTGSGLVNGSTPDGDVMGYACAEDDTYLVNHVSSSEEFSKYDMGFTSSRHHEEYRRHYPNGFDLIWVTAEQAYQELSNRA